MAFVMLVWGGVQWLLSGAMPSQAADARDKIKNAILGLLLILASFLIVQIINPELTLVGGFGIPNTDCRRQDPDDPSSPCVEIEAVAKLPTAGLTVNGLQSATVNSGDSVQLAWNVSPRFNNCEGRSTPTGLWGSPVRSIGPAEFEGSETVGPITTSPTFFRLDCWKTGSATALSQQVIVTISSGAPQGPAPTADLKIDPDRNGPQPPSDGSVSFKQSTLFYVIWSSTNADQCWGGAYAVGINGPPSGQYTKRATEHPGDYIYDVTCFDDTGQSASDQVTVKILEP